MGGVFNEYFQRSYETFEWEKHDLRQQNSHKDQKYRRIGLITFFKCLLFSESQNRRYDILLVYTDVFYNGVNMEEDV